MIEKAFPTEHFRTAFSKSQKPYKTNGKLDFQKSKKTRFDDAKSISCMGVSQVAGRPAGRLRSAQKMRRIPTRIWIFYENEVVRFEISARPPLANFN